VERVLEIWEHLGAVALLDALQKEVCDEAMERGALLRGISSVCHACGRHKDVQTLSSSCCSSSRPLSRAQALVWNLHTLRAQPQSLSLIMHPAQQVLAYAKMELLLLLLLLLLQMLLLPLLQVLLLLLLPQVLLLLGLQGFCILSCSSRSCGLLLLARSGAVAAPTSMVTSRSRLSSAHFPGQREVAARRRAADLPGSCVVRARSFLCCVESAQPPPGPRRGVSDLCRPFAPGALPDAPVGLVGALGVDDISGWGSSADSALVMLLDRGFLLWLLLLPHRLPLSKVS